MPTEIEIDVPKFSCCASLRARAVIECCTRTALPKLLVETGGHVVTGGHPVG